LWDLASEQEIVTRDLQAEAFRKKHRGDRSPVWLMNEYAAIRCLGCVATGSSQLLVGGTGRGEVPIWNLEDFRLQGRLDTGGTDISGLASSKAGKRALLGAVTREGGVTVWRLGDNPESSTRTNARMLFSLPRGSVFSGRVTAACAFASLHRQSVFLAAAQEERLGVWDLSGRRLLDIDVRSPILDIAARDWDVVIGTDQGLIRLKLLASGDTSAG
jgi:WD40 repeat protein